MTEPDRTSRVEPHYQDAYMHAPVGRAVLTADGDIARGNYALADLLGRRHGDIEGRRLAELVPELASAFGESTIESEIETPQPGGRTRCVRVSVSPMRNGDGIVGYDLYAFDLTALRAAEAEIRRTEAEFRALVEHSSDIITVLEPDGSWRSSSAAGTRLLGWPAGFDPPGGIFSVLHPDDVELAHQAFQEVVTGRRQPDEPIVLRALSADGSRYLTFETVAQDLTRDPAVRGIVVTSRDITDQVQAEAALEEKDARFESLVHHATEVTTVVEEIDGEVQITWASPSIARVLGYAPDEVIGTDPTTLIHPDDLDHMYEESANAVTAGEPALVEYRAIAKDGTFRQFEAITTDLRHVPSVHGFVTNARDITERRDAERQAEQLTEVLELSIEVVVLSDATGNVVWANQRAREILGVGTQHHVSELSSIESREKVRDIVMPFVRRHGVWTGELTLRSSSGDEIPVIATVQGHRERGEIVRVSTIAHDITELKADQHRLEYEATHDPLTALPNRAMLHEVGEQALGRAARRDGTTGVLFLDLDRFKGINDTLGHDAGDRVLIELARRLRVGVRTGDLVARLGGDEFCVLCENVEDEQEILDLGQRICDVVSIPMKVLGRDVQLGTSIGIAFDVGGRSTMGGLLRNADIALYRSKRAGGSTVSVFDAASIGAEDPATAR